MANTCKISQLLLTPRKRGREETDTNNEHALLVSTDGNPPSKKLRRSTRVRFSPLKFWANETILTDPKKILTMKEVQEKGDALLSSTKDELCAHWNRNKPEAKRRAKPATTKKQPKQRSISQLQLAEHGNDGEQVALRSVEYQCDEWSEYQSDPYYALDQFDGTALARDICHADDDAESAHKITARKRLVTLPNAVNMNKTGNIYGGQIVQCKTWKSGFLEIPPTQIIEREVAEETALFFVHRAERKKLKFTICTSPRYEYDYDEQKRTFYLSQEDLFYVPHGHFYEIQNLSLTTKVHLTVTQFINNDREVKQE